MPSVTRRSQSSRQERRERIERQLLDATERLMSGGASFTELSVDRLATEAGISRASFYVYFEDKGDLLRRLASQVFADLADGAQRWWQVADRRRPEDAHAAMAAVVAAYRHHQPLLVALSEMSGYDPLVSATYSDLIGQIAGRLGQVIESGKHDGVIPAGVATESTALALTWMVEQTCQKTLPGRPDTYDAELAATLTRIVWAALYYE